ncbi:capsule assembly Wzi family protein [Teredinibacter haidensis]|uniref:capsule assembly Wzi family protein n=1 Tax=Teredinibacter haidensis TaxID=2731755 RepID=UPI000A52CD0D|nr:capsule assembly Wzi family protein [Teredinibacter haidensis]
MKSSYGYRLKPLLFLSSLFFCSQSIAAENYLPIHLDPGVEAKVEKLFVLVNMPIIKRPIAVKNVRKAIAKLGDKNPSLTATLNHYLKRYEHNAGIVHAQIKVSSSSGKAVFQPNSRGADTNGSYQGSIAGYWKVSSLVNLNMGALAYDQSLAEKGQYLENTYLSIGNEYIQADIGNRPHWFGPFQESDMLQSTNAATSTGVTVSNTTPLTKFGIRYEIFLTQMSESDVILSEDHSERLTGKPKLLGVHASAEPIEGFSLSFNRLLQYGGADRDDSLSTLYKAFINAKKQDNSGDSGNDFGNQLSSIATRYTFTGDFPISIYMEYAGEDTSKTSDFHLGNTSLMLGIHLPQITDKLDLSYEHAEWQNSWYVNGNYGDGLRQHNGIMGHWAASQRNFNDAVGADSHTVKLNWHINSEKTLITKYRQVSNQDYSSSSYETGYLLEAEYSQIFKRITLGGRFLFGNDVFGESYSQISGVIRW